MRSWRLLITSRSMGLRISSRCGRLGVTLRVGSCWIRWRITVAGVTLILWRGHSVLVGLEQLPLIHLRATRGMHVARTDGGRHHRTGVHPVVAGVMGQSIGGRITMIASHHGSHHVGMVGMIHLVHMHASHPRHVAHPRHLVHPRHLMMLLESLVHHSLCHEARPHIDIRTSWPLWMRNSRSK